MDARESFPILRRGGSTEDARGHLESDGTSSQLPSGGGDVGERVGGVQPLVTFQPIPPPNGSESEGPTEITFAPSGFPAGLDDGLFVGFHGEFGSAGVANAENPLVYVDLSTGHYFHFVANTEPAIGHLNSLLATSDSLFAADLSSTGSLSTAGNGVIYQIRANPPPVPGLGPGAIAILVALFLGFAAVRHTAKR